jgi:hypothetical protein
MTRQTYKLTDETRLVLNAGIDAISKEMDVDDSYLYGIRAGNNTDPFAPYLRLFRGAAYANAPVEKYLFTQQAIYLKARKIFIAGNAPSALLEKIRVDAKTTERIYEALSDGILDKRECEELLALVPNMRDVVDAIETILTTRLAELVQEEKPNLRAVG